MSTIVYHQQQQQLLGFQSRHETHQLVDPSCSLSLKLNPPKQQQQQQHHHHNHNQQQQQILSGWSSIQSLTPTINSKDEVYIHPLTKQSSSKLSDNSLQMCTENLGCETGTDIIHTTTTTTNTTFLFSFTSSLSKSSNNQHSSSSSSVTPVSSRQIMKTSHHHHHSKKSPSFPPPLTSMTGSNSLRLRPHRESGRLVMTAISTSSQTTSNIQTHRSNGRLTMSLVMDNSQQHHTTVNVPYSTAATPPPPTPTTDDPTVYFTDIINESQGRDEYDKCHLTSKHNKEDDKTTTTNKPHDIIIIIPNPNHISNSKQQRQQDDEHHDVDDDDDDDDGGVHVVEMQTDKQGPAMNWKTLEREHQWPTRCNQNGGGRGSTTTTLINWVTT